MPWNDNANSGGKPDKKPGGKPSPWGAPPSGGGTGGGGSGRGGGGGPERPLPRGPGPRRPRKGGPGLGELGAGLGDRLRDFFDGGGGKLNKGAIGAVAAGVVALWALSGIYIVQSDEQAVVTTFGAYSGTAGPGLHIRAPFPIQRHQKVSVTTVRRTQIGGSTAAENLQESLMLTSDENIIDLDFTVQWRVTGARDYLFNLDNVEEAVSDVAESAMREIVGKTPLQALITTERGRAQAQALELMQQTLDSYRAGVAVDLVLIDNAGPPPPVVEAFRAVTAAEQEAESIQNLARGEAARIEQTARAYAIAAEREAEGEAARFDQLHAQYKLAPGVTRERLYIETMQRVLGQSNKVVIDSEGASAPIILPPDVFRPRTTPQTTTPGPVVSDQRVGGGR